MFYVLCDDEDADVHYHLEFLQYIQVLWYKYITLALSLALNFADK